MCMWAVLCRVQLWLTCCLVDLLFFFMIIICTFHCVFLVFWVLVMRWMQVAACGGLFLSHSVHLLPPFYLRGLVTLQLNVASPSWNPPFNQCLLTCVYLASPAELVSVNLLINSSTKRAKRKNLWLPDWSTFKNEGKYDFLGQPLGGVFHSRVTACFFFLLLHPQWSLVYQNVLKKKPAINKIREFGF